MKTSIRTKIIEEQVHAEIIEEQVHADPEANLTVSRGHGAPSARPCAPGA